MFLHGLTVAVGALALAWVGYGFALWWLQEAMIFPAPGGIGAHTLDLAAAELGAEPLHLRAEDGTALYGWYKPATSGRPGRRAVLYFHGNGETVAAGVPLMQLANRHGWDFAVVAFRGYPGSEGAPSEAGVARDARALWDHVTGARGIDAARVVLHGRSLGGAVAIRLASERRPGGLVVESSFTSMVDMARRQAPLYPVRLLLRHPFDSAARAPSIDVPVLVLHGSADRVVPVAMGRALARRFPDARYVEVPGGTHNELLVLASDAARRAWLALLDRVDGGG